MGFIDDLADGIVEAQQSGAMRYAAIVWLVDVVLVCGAAWFLFRKVIPWLNES